MNQEQRDSRFPELEIDPSKLPRLAKNNCLADKLARTQFHKLDEIEQIKYILKQPLPLITDYGQVSARRCYTETTESLISTQPAGIGAENPYPFPTTFDIQNTKFDVGIIPYQFVFKTTVQLTSNSSLSQDDMDNRLVKPLLHTKISYFFELPETISTLNQSISEEAVYQESSIEKHLSQWFFESIRPVIVKTHDDVKARVSNAVGELFQDSGVVITPKYHDLQLTPEFVTSSKLSTEFMGINSFPDLQTCYTVKKKQLSNKPIFITRMIEVRYLSMDIERFHRLSTLPQEQNTAELLELSDGEITNLDEVQKTIDKNCTLCFHLGVNRFVLTNGDCFLLVFLHPPKREKEDINEREEGKSIDEINSDILIETKLEPEVNVKQLECSHYLVKNSDEYVRLYVSAFLCVTDEDITELFKFQDAVTKELVIYRNDQMKKYNIRQNFQDPQDVSLKSHKADESPRDRNNEYEIFDSVSVCLMSNTPVPNIKLSNSSKLELLTEPEIEKGFSKGDGPIINYMEYKKELFRDVIPLDLFPLITDTLSIGHKKTQVVQINSNKFHTNIPLENKFFGDDIKDEMLVLKVFDCLLNTIHHNSCGFTLAEDVYDIQRKISYQQSIDYAVGEIKCYFQLEELQGVLIPKMFSVGRLVDLYPVIGKPAIKLWGPFLCTEDLTDFKDPNFNESAVNEEFMRTKLEPAFKLLHKYGVIHNDAKFDNIIVGRDCTVKIIDFDIAEISFDEEKQKSDIDRLYRNFNIKR